jgi:flagellar FliL protein
VPEEIEKAIESEAPSRKFPIKWILIGVTVLVLAGGGFVGWTMVRSDSPAGPDQQTPLAPQASKAAPEPDVGQTFTMDPFVVNLNEPGGKRYLKSKIELEFMEEKVRQELDLRLPQLRDVILMHLSSKALDDIQSVDGKIELKNALITRINQVLKQGKIRNLYFTQFVIQ